MFLSQINQWIAGYESYRPIEPASEGNFTQSDLAVRIMRGIGSMNPQLSEIVSELIKKSNSNDAHVQLADLFDLLKKKKCLLIADDANALFSKNTSYRSPEGKTIKTENMKVIDAVQDFAIAENTTLLTAINASDPLLPSFVPDDVAPLFTDFIKIDPLDVPETGALLNYYISKGHILKSLTRHWREKMRFCSGGNPSLLLKACAYDSVFHPE